MAVRLRRSVDAVYQSLSRLHRQLRLCVERRLRAARPQPAPDEAPVGEALT
jgi:hypothetical protein